MPIINCFQCGQSFHRKQSHINRVVRQFCSNACRGMWQSEQTRFKHPHHKLKTVICFGCKNPTIKSNWQIKRHKKMFCSKECYLRWKASISKSEYKSCYICGKKKRFDVSKLKRNKFFFCSKKCKAIWDSQRMSGKNHPMWNGGRIDYYGPDWHRQKRKARKRDNYTCQDCGIHESILGKCLDVHHLIAYKINHDNSLLNLISLCPSCHMIREWAIVLHAHSAPG